MIENYIKEVIAAEIAAQFEKYFRMGANTQREPEREAKPYTINDIVSHFGVTRQTVRRWEQANKIVGTRIGRRVFYPAADVEALVSNRRNAR